MKKSIKITLIILGILFILSLVYINIFVFERPFMGEITQDRPMIKKLCEMQVRCNVGVGLYQCYSVGQNKYIINDKPIKWQGYKGCNESTLGFYEREDGYKGIYVEGCGCGGLM